MRRCGMRWSRATVDRWAARGVPFAVKFIAYKYTLLRASHCTRPYKAGSPLPIRTAKLSWLWPG
eukprot:917617-Prymnesium_polylepis.1